MGRFVFGIISAPAGGSLFPAALRYSTCLHGFVPKGIRRTGKIKVRSSILIVSILEPNAAAKKLPQSMSPSADHPCVMFSLRHQKPIQRLIVGRCGFLPCHRPRESSAGLPRNRPSDQADREISNGFSGKATEALGLLPPLPPHRSPRNRRSF